MNPNASTARSGTLPPAIPRFAIPEDEFRDLLQRPAFETQILVEQCLGDEAFALSLLEDFIKILPDRRDKLLQADQDQNAAQLLMLAHALKGASAYAAAPRLSAKCGQLEEMAAAKCFHKAAEVLKEVCLEIDRCINDFARICRTLTASPTAQRSLAEQPA